MANRARHRPYQTASGFSRRGETFAVFSGCAGAAVELTPASALQDCEAAGASVRSHAVALVAAAGEGDAQVARRGTFASLSRAVAARLRPVLPAVEESALQTSARAVNRFCACSTRARQASPEYQNTKPSHSPTLACSQQLGAPHTGVS